METGEKLLKDCRILVAEDDTDDISLLKDAFKELGASNVLEFAENGIEVLQKLEGKDIAGKLPHLIVIDANMPKLSGMQTLERLQADQRFKDIPVMIYTTSLNAIDMEKSFRLGASNYISKPSTFASIIETAEYFISFCLRPLKKTFR